MEYVAVRAKQERLWTDLSTWEIGPYHSALPGPMGLRLLLDGEVVVTASVETGFMHRGLEKAMERSSWIACGAIANRVDGEAPVFAELAFCTAVEGICGTPVPPRAECIRTLLCELSRVSSHLAYFGRMAREVGTETLMHYVLRDRERILDLFELLTGARFSLNFLRVGGVAADMTEGFVERVAEACDLIRVRLKEYNDLLSYNFAFIRRTEGIGLVSQEVARWAGLTGPSARASGLPFDARRDCHYGLYDVVDFEVMGARTEFSGDCHGRFLLRMREVAQSVEILKQLVETVPPGEFNSCREAPRNPVVPAGEAYSRVESARGLLGCHVASDGTPRPARVQFRVPSGAALALISKILPGSRIEDVPVILSSLDLSISEADR